MRAERVVVNDLTLDAVSGDVTASAQQLAVARVQVAVDDVDDHRLLERPLVALLVALVLPSPSTAASPNSSFLVAMMMFLSWYERRLRLPQT